MHQYLLKVDARKLVKMKVETEPLLSVMPNWRIISACPEHVLSSLEKFPCTFL